jgi:transposase IS66 family protein
VAPRRQLTVDAYGIQRRRRRVAPQARSPHLRRYINEALPTAPIAQEAIELILGLHRVEHDAKEQEITARKLISGFDGCGQDLSGTRAARTPSRTTTSAQRVRSRGRSDTRSPMSRAPAFSRRTRVNSASERSLRRVALGRKNYLSSATSTPA